MKTMNTRSVGQLELGLQNDAGRLSQSCPTSERRQRRQTRARYWFERMRQVVDCARDWPAAPVAPEPLQREAEAERHLAE